MKWLLVAEVISRNTYLYIDILVQSEVAKNNSSQSEILEPSPPDASALPYSIETIDLETGTFIVHYSAPEELIDILTSRQVLARGSFFDIVRDAVRT
jgi:hypothetical protein